MTLIFIFLFATWPVSRADETVNAAFLRMQHNVSCKYSVTSRDVDDYKAGACTQHNGMFKKLPRDAHKMYSQAVLQDAANLQVTKNECLEEQVRCLESSEDAFKDWYRYLETAWLSSRKAALVLEQCAQHGTTDLDPNQIYNEGFDKAYENMRSNWPLQRQKSTPALTGELREICSRPEMLETLATAIEVLQQSMPFVSDEKFFSTMEGYRGSVISKKTGKPITDAEILANDLSDPNQIIRTNFDNGHYAAAKGDIQKRLDLFVKGRKEMNQSIARAARDKFGRFPLTDSVMRAMYNDGSIHQVLSDKNQIPPGYVDLDRAARGTVNPGAVCLLAYFEHSPIGAALDFGLTSILYGGLAKRLFTGTKYLGKPFFDKMTQFNAGATIGGLPMAGHQAYGVCMQEKRSLAFNDSRELQHMRNVGKYFMPDSVGYRADEKWEIKKCPVERMPACKKLKDQKVTLSSVNPNIVNCLRGIAEGNIPLPMKIMLPIEVMR